MPVLYPHQQEALKWIRSTEEQPRLHEEQPRGGILAHEMGLGKTITMLTHMSSCSTGLNLVICPKSVLMNWMHEATNKGFYSSEQVFVYYGLNRKSTELVESIRLVLTTFDIVRTESAFKKTSLLYTTTWKRIVLDEAHRIAERNSKTSKSISQLRGHNRWCLTGTPYKNGLSDIVALCKFLKIQPYSKATWWKHNAHNECSLRQWRASHLHIRHKSASFLPPIKVKNCFLDCTPLEKWIQDTVRATQLPSDNKGKLQEFELLKILRMRQAAVHPLLFLPDDARQYLLQHPPCMEPGHCSACGKVVQEVKVDECEEQVFQQEDTFAEEAPLQSWNMKSVGVTLTLACDRHALCAKCSCNSLICPTCLMDKYRAETVVTECAWPHSSKTQQVLEVIQKGHKTVIFSQWTSCLDLLGQMCEQYGVPVLRFDGNVSSVEERNNVIDQFAAREDTRVLLTSLGAGAEGIDLTCATTVVLVEPSWNRAIEKQAIDRVHRLGQQQRTRVYKLTLTQSIENWITELQHLKQQELDFYLNGKTPEPLSDAVKSDNSSLSKRQQRLFEKTGGGSLHTWRKTPRVNSTTSKPVGGNMLSTFISCEL